MPAQYDPAVPASLMIYNDGQAFMAPEGDVRAQVVMDNLIYRREIPVMIGSLHQSRPPARSAGAERQANGATAPPTGPPNTTRWTISTRASSWMNCFRCSTRSTTYRRIPERHGIGGSSSGAIAAFTVAWERPDDFRKVLSNVGSFTNIRGGNAYPDIIRKSEKKPIAHFPGGWPER